MSHTLYLSALASIVLSAAVTAQTGAPQQTNLGPVSGFVSTGHVLTPPPVSGRSGTASRSYDWPSEIPSVAGQLGAPQRTNLGSVTGFVSTGHVLTPPATSGQKSAATRVLYCPSENDDPVLRAAIAAQLGGGTVDYFDARVANPGGALLATYDAAFTWANFAYFDNVGLGNELATFVDNGGNVVLGSFCTYTSGNSLAGAIMGVGYSPVVSPSGSNHFSSSKYVGDGATCIYSGVSGLTATYRDILVTQGGGVVDGTYLDGEITHAFSPIAVPGAGSVVYSNGAGGSQLSPSGDWPIAVGNAIICMPGGGAAGSCTFRAGVLGTNPWGYNCVTVPVAGLVWQATIATTPLLGTKTMSTILTVGLGGATNGVPLFGFEMLCLPPFILNTAFGTHNIPVPLGTSGIGVPTQGVRIETGPTGNVFIVLLNAQDLVIG